MAAVSYVYVTQPSPDALDIREDMTRFRRFYPMPAAQPAQMKQCLQCKEELPLEDFPIWNPHGCAISKDGHRRMCWYCIEKQAPKPPKLLDFERERMKLWQLNQQLSDTKEAERRLLNTSALEKPRDESFRDIVRRLRRTYQELWQAFLRLKIKVAEAAGELGRLVFSCGRPGRA